MFRGCAARLQDVLVVVLRGLLLWACGVAAHAADVTLTCTNPVDGGAAFSFCEGGGGSVVEVLVAALGPLQSVPVCSGVATPSGGSCAGMGGTVVWRVASSLAPTAWIYTGDLAEGEYVVLSSLSYWPFDGGGEDPGGDFDPSSLEPSELLSAFSAGFVLVAMFWGLGKGVALVLSIVRR